MPQDQTTPPHGAALHYDAVRPDAIQADLDAVAPYLFWLMFRNVASDGLVFNDPVNVGVTSQPGCVLASPSWENSATHISQDYVYHWTRDAAVVAIELARGPLASRQPLVDYVAFAQACADAATEIGHFGRAAFRIDGSPRTWTDQADGPALQTIALLAAYGQLDAATQAVARNLISANLAFLRTAYQGSTFNLWEEEYGDSFFARAVQLRCFTQVAANTVGISVPPWLPPAIGWLDSALEEHWNGTLYESIRPAPADYRAPYDPNADIVMAAIYGAVPVTDPRLLATAAQLRAQWADPASPYFYPINGADAGRGIGPLLGRYPGDVYDGDTDAMAGDHPWALTTANFAELYYRLASSICSSAVIPSGPLAARFLGQAGIAPPATPAQAVTALRAAGDAMLQAIVFHSDHLELSEQFDATTGYEKSVSNLSWSYAAFLSAIRARDAVTAGWPEASRGTARRGRG
jgi:glucoamylase